MSLNGNYEGKVTKAQWFTHERDGTTVPYLSLDVQVGEVMLNPALWFDQDIKTQGVDQGKTGIQVALEVLQSYGVECDPADPHKCDPATFGPGLEGETVKVYCDTKNGKQRVFLNKRSREAASAETIGALWKGIAGASGDVAPAPRAAKPKPAVKTVPKTASDEDDDDLAF